VSCASTGTSCYSLYLQVCDDNVITNWHQYGSNATFAYNYSVSGAANFSSGNQIFGIETGSGDALQLGGTPSGAVLNEISGFMLTNGDTKPSITNLTVH
jgi:hypothetical protein